MHKEAAREAKQKLEAIQYGPAVSNVAKKRYIDWISKSIAFLNSGIIRKYSLSPKKKLPNLLLLVARNEAKIR